MKKLISLALLFSATIGFAMEHESAQAAKLAKLRKFLTTKAFIPGNASLQTSPYYVTHNFMSTNLDASQTAVAFIQQAEQVDGQRVDSDTLQTILNWDDNAVVRFGSQVNPFQVGLDPLCLVVTECIIEALGVKLLSPEESLSTAFGPQPSLDSSLFGLVYETLIKKQRRFANLLNRILDLSDEKKLSQKEKKNNRKKMLRTLGLKESTLNPEFLSPEGQAFTWHCFILSKALINIAAEQAESGNIWSLLNPEKLEKLMKASSPTD